MLLIPVQALNSASMINSNVLETLVLAYSLFHKTLIATDLSDDNYRADGQLEKFQEHKKPVALCITGLPHRLCSLDNPSARPSNSFCRDPPYVSAFLWFLGGI